MLKPPNKENPGLYTGNNRTGIPEVDGTGAGRESVVESLPTDPCPSRATMFFAPIVSHPDCVRQPPVPVPVVKTRLPTQVPTCFHTHTSLRGTHTTSVRGTHAHNIHMSDQSNDADKSAPPPAQTSEEGRSITVGNTNVKVVGGGSGQKKQAYV